MTLIWIRGAKSFRIWIKLWGYFYFQKTKFSILFLQNINDLKDLVGIREYSVVSEEKFCFVGLPNLYLGFVGNFFWLFQC